MREGVETMEGRPMWYELAGDVETCDDPPIPVRNYAAMPQFPKRRKHVALTMIDPQTGAARDVAKHSDIPDGYITVSTVFLGMDHEIDGPPVLWESLPRANGEWLDSLMQRYTSRKAAIAGHIVLVRFLSDRVKRREPIYDGLELSDESE